MFSTRPRLVLCSWSVNSKYWNYCGVSMLLESRPGIISLVAECKTHSLYSEKRAFFSGCNRCLSRLEPCMVWSDGACRTEGYSIQLHRVLASINMTSFSTPTRRHNRASIIIFNIITAVRCFLMWECALSEVLWLLDMLGSAILKLLKAAINMRKTPFNNTVMRLNSC